MNEKSRRSSGRFRLPDIPRICLSRSVTDEFTIDHQLGSLVWAKVAGHSDPVWPGVVRDVKTFRGVLQPQTVNVYINTYK